MPGMTQPAALVIKSTSDLTPNKILGYAKGIVGTVGAILTILNEQVVPDDWAYKSYLTAAIAICTVIGVVAVPNAVKPVTVPPPAVNVDPEAEHVGEHRAPEAILGVVQPPVPPNDGI